ncbi:undecaprenyldiphospho-muramoylpentapeptide beta-N-acetylglucosaminyltransferase [Catenovulum maritimum]|uniref:UDP-N-acetylglucosamine--N-acetylmuramyl-(pentapeptide) pyrophosphoryl-undecaprenol N-acetylglucosamine transferase n=1 Tax=Catenovulum maritimum TaxID=1513271 RepID=A0A0J8GS43_9ALTE|nr:undecaprenyldiphospho-muramoylpentapeptide beta-N-acetylglucosaminyltransferase [Catenovulum maritimum]KMT65625.1 UDP-diphospho-muramoylpentapeptide beta-N- acetylglucosaminyltransferase [Catenovulum maritimum]
MAKKILIMAGGTGGHIFPGLAIADELSNKGWQVLWLGTADRMEADLVPNAGYPIEFIEIKGVRNKGIIRKVLTPLMVINAVLQARKIIKKFKPDVVVGFGGYAALPGGIAAKLSAIPLVIHEQNAAAGLTNRILSKIAAKVLVAFDNVTNLPDTTVKVGNPLRQQILTKTTRGNAAELSILVVGGSLGAQVLNQQVPAALKQLEANNIKVLHQAGKGKLESTLESYQGFTGEYQVVEFITDMAQAYQAADLVICRAGALTVSELAQTGIASVLVPLPHAVDDHQTKNAQVLVNAKAGILLPQTELTTGGLVPVLKQILATPDMVEKMAIACQQVATPQARQVISEQIENLVQG